MANREDCKEACEQFEALLAEWFENRARGHRGPEESDEDCGHRLQREGELARLICITPAAQPWMIHTKIEVLEHYLYGRFGGTAWADNRDLALLGGIKADLRTFEPRSPDSE